MVNPIVDPLDKMFDLKINVIIWLDEDLNRIRLNRVNEMRYRWSMINDKYIMNE